MKTLTVYHNGSIDKFLNLFEDYTYELDANDGILRIIRCVRGECYEDYEHMVFRTWDYYVIEVE